MKTFQQLSHLVEMYPFEVDNVDGDGQMTTHEVSFRVPGGEKYLVFIEAYHGSKYIKIDFTTKKLFKAGDESQMNQKTGKAGPFGAVGIFLTIGKIIDEAIYDYPGYRVLIQAIGADQQRVKLYGELAKRLAHKYGGTVTDRSSANGNHSYWIKW